MNQNVNQFSFKQWLKKTSNSITNWARNLKLSYWINIALWILTLIFLIVIIIVSALQGNDAIGYLGGSKDNYANIIAVLVLVFALLLSVSIIHIVIVKMIEKKKGVKNVANA